MGFEFWYTSLLLIIMTIVLVKEWADIEIAVTVVLLLLIIGKVITPMEAFSGFSNIGVLSIGILFVVAGSIKSTGLLGEMDHVIYGNKKSTITRKMFRFFQPS
jgi:hypothetical protein